MTPCDEWTGGSFISGYGVLHVAYVDGKGITMRAHRLVYMQTFGHTDLLILHSCDTPTCINIDHLREGTHQDNSDDKMERGRHSNGRSERTHCPQGHKYTEDNIYWSKVGGRQCKTCKKAMNDKRTQQKREADAKV